MNQKVPKCSFSQAEKLAAIALFITIPLFGVGSSLAPIPLVFFLLLCSIAPFFPQWGFFLPIISKSITGSKAVALTFDDGPDPVSNPILLQLLKQYNLKATFFVIGEKAEQFPELIQRILADGHTLGNHSWQHDSLLMLRTKKRLRQDIRKTQEVLQSHGVRPLVFRPPAGATNPRLKSVLCNEGLQVVNFSCRPFDHGNKKINHLAERILEKLQPGNIILLHDLAQHGEKHTQIWKQEINALLLALQKSGTEVQPLEQLIGFPVMQSTSSNS